MANLKQDSDSLSMVSLKLGLHSQELELRILDTLKAALKDGDSQDQVASNHQGTNSILTNSIDLVS